MTQIKSRISSMRCGDEYETRRTGIFQEVLLEPKQLQITGIAPAIEIGFSNDVVDGDILTIKNNATTEIYTFKNAPAVAFDVLIGGSPSGTRDQLVITILADSAIYGATKTPNNASNLNIYRLAFDGTNDTDRIFANLTVQTDIVYVALNDGLYDINFGAVAVILPTSDPAVKEFGFGRIESEFKFGEIHSFLNDAAGTIKRWNPLTFSWQFTSTPFASGSYGGDGTTGLSISGLGFKPRNLEIVAKETGSGSNVEVLVTTDVINDDSGSGMAIIHKDNSPPTPHESIEDAIVSLDEDGFTVSDGGIDANPNSFLITYNWKATG